MTTANGETIVHFIPLEGKHFLCDYNASDTRVPLHVNEF